MGPVGSSDDTPVDIGGAGRLDQRAHSPGGGRRHGVGVQVDASEAGRRHLARNRHRRLGRTDRHDQVTLGGHLGYRADRTEPEGLRPGPGGRTAAGANPDEVRSRGPGGAGQGCPHLTRMQDAHRSHAGQTYPCSEGGPDFPGGGRRRCFTSVHLPVTRLTPSARLNGQALLVRLFPRRPGAERGITSRAAPRVRDAPRCRLDVDVPSRLNAPRPRLVRHTDEGGRIGEHGNGGQASGGCCSSTGFPPNRRGSGRRCGGV